MADEAELGGRALTSGHIRILVPGQAASRPCGYSRHARAGVAACRKPSSSGGSYLVVPVTVTTRLAMFTEPDVPVCIASSRSFSLPSLNTPATEELESMQSVRSACGAELRFWTPGPASEPGTQRVVQLGQQ